MAGGIVVTCGGEEERGLMGKSHVRCEGRASEVLGMFYFFSWSIAIGKSMVSIQDFPMIARGK